MLVERLLPEIVGATAPLKQQALTESSSMGFDLDLSRRLVALISGELADAGCFFDLVTKLWRYEFGLPRRVGNKLLWGTHMWLPVRNLLAVLKLVQLRLSPTQQQALLNRLNDPNKHEETLAEFMPALRFTESLAADYEFHTGVGAHNVDWRIRPQGGPPILMEVKKRIADLLQVTERIDEGERDGNGMAPAPKHDVSLLFRSIAKKLSPSDPDVQLQSAWVAPELQQEGDELDRAFAELDCKRVHFVILGGWEPGLTILTRRAADEVYLREVFPEAVGDRFRFLRDGNG